MIFDYELMFTDKNTAAASQSSGVIGRELDLAGAGAGKGFKSWIGFAFNEDISGGPLSFTLETADNDEFTDAKEIPLSMPPLTSDDMCAGSIYSAPLPVVGMERFCRLKITSGSDVTLSGLECGFVLDATQV